MCKYEEDHSTGAHREWVILVSEKQRKGLGTVKGAAQVGSWETAVIKVAGAL